MSNLEKLIKEREKNLKKKKKGNFKRRNQRKLILDTRLEAEKEKRKLKPNIKVSNLIIGNTIESLMFAILNNYKFIFNGRNYYYWHESYVKMGDFADLNSVFSSLLQFWFACGNVIGSTRTEKIKFRAKRVIEVFEKNHSVYVKFQNLFMFSDNLFEDFYGVLVEEKKIKIIERFSSRLINTVVTKNPLIISTGKKHPQFLCLLTDKKRRELIKDESHLSESEINYVSFKLYSNMFVSYMKYSDFKKTFDKKATKTYFGDFMKYFGASLKGSKFYDILFIKESGVYKDSDYIICMNKKEELNAIWQNFWTDFFKETPNSPFVFKFRNMVPREVFINDFFQSEGNELPYQITSKEKENESKIASEISKMYSVFNQPNKSA